MTATQVVTGTRRRLAGIWGQSLLRTGHLLVATSVINAGVGIGYWLVAARLNPPSVVGVNSAAISAMMLLAGIAQLNLMSALLRFVPAAGPAAGRMIRSAYLAGASLSGVAAVIFLLGLGYWAPDLAGLLRPGLPAVGFVAATMFWSLFVMQDNVLVAVRRPVGVPAENMVFAVLKLVLVVVFSLSVAGTGIWLSWTVAMAVTVTGVTGYLFLRAVPAFARASAPETAHVATPRELARFIGPDYVGSLAYIAGTSLVPLLVLDLVGPRQSSVFALAWTVCAALYQVPIAFGQSLVAHGVLAQDRLAEYHRKVLGQSLRLLVPVVAGIVLFAPLGLGFFGPWYAAHGVWTLRLLALSALPNAVTALAVSRARVTRRMRTVVAVLTSLSALVLGLTVVLVPHLGIVGGGIAWLGGQTAVALAVLGRGGMAGLRSRLVRSSRGGVPGPVVEAALAGRALAGRGWAPERTLPTVSDTAVIMVRALDGADGVLKVTGTASGAASLRREQEVLRRLRADERLGGWRALLPAPLAAGDLDGGAFLLASRLPGPDGRALPPAAAGRLTAAAFEAIAPLHRLAPAATVADEAALGRWLDEPAERVRQLMPASDGIDGLVAAVRAGLAGRPLALGWTHGDFYPGNVLTGPDGQVTGLVDWSQAAERDLIAVDLMFWLLTVPDPGQPRELGGRVAARLAAPRCWTPAEDRLLNEVTFGDPAAGRALLLLAWLRHVAGNLAKSDRYLASPLWARRNIRPVLRQVGHG